MSLRPEVVYLLVDGNADDAMDSSYSVTDIVRGAFLSPEEAHTVATTWPEHVTSPRVVEIPVLRVANP